MSQRSLLTWGDRAAGWQKYGGKDPGPVLRFAAVTDGTYARAVVLCPRRSRAATKALARDLRAHLDEVEVVPIDLEDPSDHKALFDALSPRLPDWRQTLPDLDVLLSAGTPQAQTLWVVLVQAGLLPARMLQVIPPQFVPVPHPHPVREVRFDIEGFPEIRALRDEVVQLRRLAQKVRTDMVSSSPAMARLSRRLVRAAQSDVAVLVLGETGAGKERVAQAVHQHSARRAGPFVVENCGAFSETALQSELFGHEAGAFTGAAGARRGLFEQADTGTLFLDEVGELSPASQVRLLRVLQTGRFRRMGAETETEVDVRIVAATHRDLRAMVKAGTFREDLYYRLCGAELEVPALRDRREDIAPLVERFLTDFGRRDLAVTRPAHRVLHQYHWPGNVRELRAEVRRWTVFCDEVVDVSDLGPDLQLAAAAEPPRLPTEHMLDEAAVLTLDEAVSATEHAVIVDVLARTGHNLSQTARLLDVDRNTLKRKMVRLGLRAG